jgi:hypothetical protein
MCAKSIMFLLLLAMHLSEQLAPTINWARHSLKSSRLDNEILQICMHTEGAKAIMRRGRWHAPCCKYCAPTANPSPIWLNMHFELSAVTVAMRSFVYIDAIIQQDPTQADTT